MISLAEARRVLSEAGWLSEQPEGFRAEVLRRGQLVRFGAGDTIYRLGDPPGGVYGLVSGAVAVVTAPPDGGPQLLHIGMPGSWIGEGSFLVREPRRVGMRAVVPTVTLHLPLEAMDRIAAEDPLAMRCFVRILMGNLDILVRAFHDLQQNGTDRRVALALLRLAPGAEVAVPVSQADLGQMAHATRGQVNAALRRFVDAGWVGKGYRSVRIRDLAALRGFAAREG